MREEIKLTELINKRQSLGLCLKGLTLPPETETPFEKTSCSILNQCYAISNRPITGKINCRLQLNSFTQGTEAEKWVNTMKDLEEKFYE